MKQGVADAVSDDFDDFDDEDCSDIEDDDGQEEFSEGKDSHGWVVEESELLVDDAALQEYESDEEDEPAKPVKANDPKVRKFQRGLAKCFQNLCKFAANPDLVDALNGSEKVASPSCRSRRNRYKSLHNNPQAQGNLLNEFLERIPLHSQQIFGAFDRSLEAMSTLPKGRESTKKSYKAGLPGAPRRRFWKWTEKCAVYASFVETGGKVEPYAGKAGGTGTTVKGYRGFNGRAKGYMETRRTGKMQGRDAPHTRAIRDGARWKLRLIYHFNDIAQRQSWPPAPNDVSPAPAPPLYAPAHVRIRARALERPLGPLRRLHDDACS